MNYDEFEENLKKAYDEYCRALEYPPEEKIFESFFAMAEERIEELESGGYSFEQAFLQYVEEELTNDIDYVIKRMR